MPMIFKAVSPFRRILPIPHVPNPTQDLPQPLPFRRIPWPAPRLLSGHRCLERSALQHPAHKGRVGHCNVHMQSILYPISAGQTICICHPTTGSLPRTNDIQYLYRLELEKRFRGFRTIVPIMYLKILNRRSKAEIFPAERGP